MGGLALVCALPCLWTATSFSQERDDPYSLGQPLSFWVKKLQQADTHARFDAIAAIQRLEAGAKPALPALTAMLREHQEWRVWSAGAGLIGHLKSDAKSAVPALVLAMKSDKEPRVRSAAIHALGTIGDASATEALVSLTRNDSNNGLRVQAIQAFGCPLG